MTTPSTDTVQSADELLRRLLVIAEEPWTPESTRAVTREAATELTRAREREKELEEAQPIETAPQDGTRILAWESKDRGWFECWWHEEFKSHPEAYWMDDADTEPNPTFWMPCPPTPRALAGGKP